MAAAACCSGLVRAAPRARGLAVATTRLCDEPRLRVLDVRPAWRRGVGCAQDPLVFWEDREEFGKNALDVLPRTDITKLLPRTGPAEECLEAHVQNTSTNHVNPCREFRKQGTRTAAQENRVLCIDYV